MKKTTLLMSLLLLSCFAISAATYTEDFEKLTKSTYSSETVTLNGYNWNFIGTLAGNGTSDWYLDKVSARLAGTTKSASNSETSKIEMLANKDGGIGNITFQYRQYGTDAQIPWDVQWSPDGTTWTTIGEITATGTVQTFSYDLNQSNARIRIIANGFTTSTANGKRINIDNIILTDNGVSAATAPTFSPIAGNYLTALSVTLTSTTTNAKIYYTTDGTDPNNSGNGTLYNGTAIPITATTTIKAIAYADGLTASSIVTAIYTFPTSVATIADLRTNTSGFYKLTGEAVLTLKTSSRNVKYVQDATGAILIDDPNGKITTAYNLGDGITGINGTLSLYSGMLQLTPVADPGAASSTGNTVTPQVVTLSDLVNHDAQLVTVNGITINDLATGGDGTFIASKNYPIAGTTTEVIRTAYSDLDYIGKPLPTTPVNVTGVAMTFTSGTTTTMELVPRSLAEIVTTGLISPNVQSLKVWTSQGKVMFNAASGEKVEIFNTVGQSLYNAPALEGVNAISVANKGVSIVKVGNRVGKVIL